MPRPPRKTQSTALAVTRPSTPARRALIDDDKSMVSSQPSVRVATLWTPTHLRSAQMMADSGDLWRLGDLCDQILGDERFGELLEKLAGLVLGCDLTWEKDARSSIGDAEKSDEISEDWPTGWSEDELIQLIIWQQLMGVGFGKHEHWVEAPSKRVVPKFHTWHPKHFAFDDDARTWKARQRLPGSSAMGLQIPIRAGDGTWIIMSRRGDFRPWAHGLWRGLSRWWLLKQYAISDWGVHSEKGSKLTIETPDGMSGEARKALAQDIFQMAKDAVISLPAGCTMKLIETTANTRDIYQAQIDAADMAAAIAILGQNLTTRVDGGSLAASESHERGENRRVRYVGRTLGRTLWTQSLPWWAEFNFGDQKYAPYPRYNTEPPEDKGAKVTTLGALADALNKLHTAGYRLPLDKIEEEYGVALEELTPEQQRTVGSGAPPNAAPPPPPQLPVPSLPGKLAKVVPGSSRSSSQSQSQTRSTSTSTTAATRPKPKLVPKLAHGDDEDDDLDPDAHTHDVRVIVNGVEHVVGEVYLGTETDPDSGTVQGQQYTDRLTAKTTEHASEALLDFTDKLIVAIDKADSLEEVSKIVLQIFADEPDPERLRELVENAIVMADLAGRHAVREDSD
jgi:phage gp29-like protein